MKSRINVSAMLTPKHIVCVFAHPDDAELLCFGTLLYWRERGAEATIIMACKGNRGISLAAMDRGEKAPGEGRRLRETQAAFQGTGIDLKSLGYNDGSLGGAAELVPSIEQELRALQPDVIVTHASDTSGADHHDHQAVGRATLNAAMRIASLRALLQPEPALSGSINFTPNIFIDITEFFEAKLRALRRHRSQAGRPYLTREFHALRSRRNAYLAGGEGFERRRMFEAFVGRIVID